MPVSTTTSKFNGHGEIVLFKWLRNSKRHNKGNFTSKSNLNKIKLGGGGGATLSCFK